MVIKIEEPKEYNITLMEAIEYLNEIVPHTSDNIGRITYDKSDEFFIDSLKLKQLISSGDIKAQKNKKSYLFSLADLENFQNKRICEKKQKEREKIIELQKQAEKNKIVNRIACIETLCLIIMFLYGVIFAKMFTWPINFIIIIGILPLWIAIISILNKYIMPK